MFDQWQYTVPANTSEADRIRLECHISKGKLVFVQVDFPYGCEHLARSRVLLGERAILPRSLRNYVTASGHPVYSQPIDEPVAGNIPILNWEVWNVDEVYDHELTLSATWITEEEERRIIERLDKSNMYLKALVESLVGESL